MNLLNIELQEKQSNYNELFLQNTNFQYYMNNIWALRAVDKIY